jgi:hypothetical protein
LINVESFTKPSIVRVFLPSVFSTEFPGAKNWVLELDFKLVGAEAGSLPVVSSTGGTEVLPVKDWSYDAPSEEYKEESFSGAPLPKR